jgi:predicted Zn-dependent peptidase
MSEYVARHYSPDNTVITVVGCIEPDEIVEKIRKAFEGFSSPVAQTQVLTSPVYRPTVVTKSKDIEQTHLCLAFPGLDLGDERASDLAVLNTMFGGGMSSLLFQTIREENALSYSVYSYEAAYTDTGLYTVYAGFNATQAEQVVHLLFKVIREFMAERIDQSELNKTREQLKSNFLLSLEATASRMSNLGRSQLLLNRTLTEDQLIAKLDAVTVESLTKLIQEIFDMRQASLCVVGNLGDWDYRELLRNA